MFFFKLKTCYNAILRDAENTIVLHSFYIELFNLASMLYED